MVLPASTADAAQAVAGARGPTDLDTGTRRFSIGLTGGIGSGKSTVADLFAALGAAVIDTDLIAHALTAPGGVAMPAISAAFGPAFISADGALDRVRMRGRVFSDAAAKKMLESILHPLIRQETERAAAVAQGTYLLYVVPLLVESGSWRARVDRIVVVDCPETVQVARVMRRNAMPETDVRAIMASQATRQARLAAADDVILNEGDASLLSPQVGHLHAAFCRMAKLDR